jgi:hypothetical protein
VVELVEYASAIERSGSMFALFGACISMRDRRYAYENGWSANTRSSTSGRDS